MDSMSDSDVQKFVWDKLMGDLDGIEAKSLFDEDEPAEKPSSSVSGVSIEIKPLTGEPKPEKEEAEELPPQMPL